MSDEIPAIRRTGEAPEYTVTTAGAGAELLRGLAEPSADRWGIARRAPCGASADEIAWRRAWHAVESCRQVAELAARR